MKVQSSGSGPSLPTTCLDRVHQPDAAEFARIGERQPASIRQVERGAQVRAAQQRAVVRDHGQLPGHAQVDDQRLPESRCTNRYLPRRPMAITSRPAICCVEQFRVGLGQRARPEDVRRGKTAADQLGPQVGGYGLNFGEFGHGSDLLERKMRRNLSASHSCRFGSAADQGRMLSTVAPAGSVCSGIALPSTAWMINCRVSPWPA